MPEVDTICLPVCLPTFIETGSVTEPGATDSGRQTSQQAPEIPVYISPVSGLHACAVMPGVLMCMLGTELSYPQTLLGLLKG